MPISSPDRDAVDLERLHLQATMFSRRDRRSEVLPMPWLPLIRRLAWRRGDDVAVASGSGSTPLDNA
jgi:hypothetical protein